jgi:hypothetical protein
MDMKKYALLGGIALTAMVVSVADAAPTDGKPLPAASWEVVGTLTSVTVTDTSNQDGNVDVALELTFNTGGPVCGTTLAAGASTFIYRSNQPNAFDAFVKNAQAALLAGKPVRYGTAKRLPSSACYPWFLLMKQ